MTITAPRRENLKVSYQYIDWILRTNRGIIGHLYQFTSLAGAVAYFTDLDISIPWNNQLWLTGSLRFEGLQRKIGIGVSVDEQSLKIWASPTDTLWGSAFLEGAQQGLLDGATLVRYRVIWPFVSGNAATDVLMEPLAVWPLFTGYVSSIGKGGASHVELKMKSALLRLNVNMPRNYFQPGCLWTLFGSGCTLNQASYAVAGTIGAGVTTKQLPIAGIPSPYSADELATYAQGRILFTSGVNAGLLTLIDNNDTGNLYLAYVLDNLPTVGDTVTYYPGCSKSFNTCQVKFNNSVNFRGFDKVPPVQVAV